MTKYQIDRGIPIQKESLQPNPWNPNHMKPRQQEAVKESIETYGQVIELLVRPHSEKEDSYEIIDGEHRYNVLPDIVYCNVIHGLSDADAKKLTIVMNETRGNADKIELAQLLADLSKDIDDLGYGLPYDPTELEELINLADVDWDQFEENFEQESASSNGEEEGWTTFTVKMPNSAMDIFTLASDRIGQQRTLHNDTAIAWGQVLEALAAEYLAQ